MKKTCMLVLTVLMAASLGTAIGFTAMPANALDKGAADENGWVQNDSMDAITLNEEGASVITTTAGGVTTYNATALDLTKVNYLTLRSTGDNWLAVSLVDDYSTILSGPNMYDPAGNQGFIKVSAIMQSGSMQLGYGYSTTGGMIGTDAGAPTDISQYITIEYYIGTGAEGDASYMKINGVQVVGQAGATLSVTRDDFAGGNAYLAFQTLSATGRTIYAMAPNEDPDVLESVEFIPTGTGSSTQAGFMLTKQIANYPALDEATGMSVYNITAPQALDNVLVNGEPLSGMTTATLSVVTMNLNGTIIQSIGLLPTAGNSFTWEVGDTVTFLEGFTVYDSAGAAVYEVNRDFGFYVSAVNEDGSCTFAAQIGLTGVGADGNFVNMNTTYNLSEGAVAEHNVSMITINGEPLTDLGYFNVAIPNTVQILKNEGNWEWNEGDVIVLPYGFTFKDSAGYTYALDANYTLTYSGGTFTMIRTEAGQARPVSVTGMQLGHYDAARNLYGMQIHFSEDVRGDMEANTDIAGEAWFNTLVQVNGRTLAEIAQINIGTADAPIYATVEANFEGTNYITIWVDARAGVVEAGDNALGNGAVVTILPGIEFPSGYITTEEQSFEWVNPSWLPTVVLEQFELGVTDGQELEGGIEAGTGNAFVNIPASLDTLTSIASFPIQDSAEVKEYVMINGQLMSQMATSGQILQFNTANTLQVQLPQGSWNVGDRFILMKGMPLYNDIPSSPNAQKVAELAHYYIFDCTSTDGKVTLTVTVTDNYEADEDIDLAFAGVQQFAYDTDRDAYGFQLHFSKNIRGDAYNLFADITNEDWIRDYITVNGKSIEELLASTDADGNVIPNAVQVVFSNNNYITIYVSAKLTAEQGGVLDAEGNVLETVRFAVADGFTVPRDNGVITQGVAYKYEYNFWCRDVDLSQVDYDSLTVSRVDNPVSVDADGNIAFKVYFDKPITDAQYNHINAGAEWLSGVDLGYTSATIERLASYGFIRDCLTKIMFNGMTIEELMNSEADPAFRPVNVVMVHYNQNEIQIVFRATSVNTNDGTFGQPTPHAINLGDPNPEWTITFLEGFTVPTLCKLDRDYTFTYNAEEGRFVEVIEEEVISEIEFEAVAYNGVMIEEGGTLELTGVTELDKNLFTVAFKGGVNPEWTLEGGTLQVGANTVTLVAQTNDGSGNTASFTFTVNVTAAQETPEETEESGSGCGSSIGAGISLVTAVLAVTMVTVLLIIKKKNTNTNK